MIRRTAVKHVPPRVVQCRLRVSCGRLSPSTGLVFRILPLDLGRHRQIGIVEPGQISRVQRIQLRHEGRHVALRQDEVPRDQVEVRHALQSGDGDAEKRVALEHAAEERARVGVEFGFRKLEGEVVVKYAAIHCRTSTERRGQHGQRTREGERAEKANRKD